MTNEQAAQQPWSGSQMPPEEPTPRQNAWSHEPGVHRTRKVRNWPNAYRGSKLTPSLCVTREQVGHSFAEVDITRRKG